VTPLDLTRARLRWPRVIRVVALLVGNEAFAERVVLRAAAGEEIYKRVVREAWQKRKLKRWLKKQTTARA